MDTLATHKIKQIGKEIDQIFTIKDLEVVLKDKANARFYHALYDLVSQGELIKVKRGPYARPKATLTSICSRVFPQSYITTGAVLAKAGHSSSQGSRDKDRSSKGIQMSAWDDRVFKYST